MDESFTPHITILKREERNEQIFRAAEETPAVGTSQAAIMMARLARIAVYVLAAALPLWFAPVAISIDFGREIAFGVLIVIATLFWLLSVLVSGEFRFHYSPLLLAGGLILAADMTSAILSPTPFLSSFFAGPSAERIPTILAGLLLMILISNLFKESRSILRLLYILVFSGALAGAHTAIQLLFGVSLLGTFIPIASGIEFNVVGTINGAMLFYAILLGITIPLAIRAQNSVIRYALTVGAGIFAFNLLLINFRNAWIVLLGASIILFALSFKDMRLKRISGARVDYLAALGLIALSMAFILIRGVVIKDLSLPDEVGPSHLGTLRIARSGMDKGPTPILFGSGPGTFGLDWNAYKDPAVNQTLFWNVRFDQGSSWMFTRVATVGAVGALALLLFFGLSLALFLRILLTRESDDETPTSTSAFLGLVGVMIAAFVYPATLTFVLMLFLTAGALLALASSANDSADNGLWRIGYRAIPLNNAWGIFISSLVIVFFLSLGIGALYLETSRFRAALAAQKGTEAFANQKWPEAAAEFDRAATIESKNFLHHQRRVQARTEQLRAIIGRAAAGENVQDEFQRTIAQAAADIQTATALYPMDTSLWITQGQLYELVIPFIAVAENFARSSYERAAELSPNNPSIRVDIGRAMLILADRIGREAAAKQGKEREEALASYTDALKQAKVALDEAVRQKPDLADGHFLLAQAALRLGNIPEAIASVERVKQAAPLDIGVAFQLGVLYFQSGNAAKSEEEFKRAVALNDNYSNARYFLGLLYDQKGDKAAAIGEFTKIQTLNPDNQEVKTILTNLKAGRGALETIVPPAKPPAERLNTPVKVK
ncbi:MAG: tetratricopeptide repeat protein [Patescibacteria group bacterium]